MRHLPGIPSGRWTDDMGVITYRGHPGQYVCGLCGANVGKGDRHTNWHLDRGDVQLDPAPAPP